MTSEDMSATEDITAMVHLWSSVDQTTSSGLAKGREEGEGEGKGRGRRGEEGLTQILSEA